MQEHAPTFNGLGLHLGNLSRLSDARSRSISSENPDGSVNGGGRASSRPPKAGREHTLGKGWKVQPNRHIQAGETVQIANIEGPGAIQSIWMTPTNINRLIILRIYWDDQEQPSVECPICDFFASPYLGREEYTFGQISSLPVCVNPGSAYNCFWEMPFQKNCRMTIENKNASEMVLYYQINYTLTEVPDDAAYFHAQYRRTNPVRKGDVHTILDGVTGKGHYVGTAMGWQVNQNGWWGEGEIKFYMDGDAEASVSDGESVGGSTGYPTICGTGTEDYFLGSYNFENKTTGQYEAFTTPYAGMPYIKRPDGTYRANTRFGLYRWHIMDPVRFTRDLKVTIQAMGWNARGLMLRQDDVSSVAFWYQTLPTAPYPELPGVEDLEII